MNRRSLLGTCVTGFIASFAGCVSRHDIPVIGNPATKTAEADQAGNLVGYDELDCNISQENSLATPVSAMRFGDGDGEHWVYLLVDSQTPIPVDIEVKVDSETIYEESVELGGDRYTSYEFTYKESYLLMATINGSEVELEVQEDPIDASGKMRVSGQTYCITTEGDVEEQIWT